MFKSSSFTTEVPENMAAPAHTPVEVGTRGTVGSLIMKEIEYFSQLELRSQDGSWRPQTHVTEMASSSSHCGPTATSVTTTQKKKKRRGNRLPSICSMVEVLDKSQPIGISGFSYRNLKSDMKKLRA
ncbi:hypothetical protein AB3S75_020078 [Citrus x aurantiifolia]